MVIIRKTVFCFVNTSNKKVFFTTIEYSGENDYLNASPVYAIHDSENLAEVVEKYPEIFVSNHETIDSMLFYSYPFSYKSLGKYVKLPAGEFLLKEWSVYIEAITGDFSVNIKIQSDTHYCSASWSSSLSSGRIDGNSHIFKGLKIKPIYTRKNILKIEDCLVSYIMNDITTKSLSC